MKDFLKVMKKKVKLIAVKVIGGVKEFSIQMEVSKFIFKFNIGAIPSISVSKRMCDFK